MDINNITTTNREDLIKVIEAADESVDISSLEYKTQYIYTDAESYRTNTSIVYSDGSTYDINGYFDISSGNVSIYSGESISEISSSESISPGEISLSSENTGTGELSRANISLTEIGLQVNGVNDYQSVSIVENVINIDGSINGSPKIIIRMKALPTSSAGLATGTLYNDGGFLKIA